MSKIDLNRTLLENAEKGQLGPFNHSEVLGASGVPLGEIVNRFGMPDARYNGAAESDDVPSIHYGNYTISFLGDSRVHYLKNPETMSLSVHFNEVVTNRDIINALGEPSELDYGIYHSLLYRTGNYTLSIATSSFDLNSPIYFIELY